MLTPISLKDSEVLESAQRMHELLNTLIETIDNYLDESDYQIDDPNGEDYNLDVDNFMEGIKLARKQLHEELGGRSTFVLQKAHYNFFSYLQRIIGLLLDDDEGFINDMIVKLGYDTLTESQKKDTIIGKLRDALREIEDQYSF